MPFSTNLNKLRLSKGLSQEKLARLADIATVNLVKLESKETANPTMKTLFKLADVLEVSLDELTGRSPKKKQKKEVKK